MDVNQRDLLTRGVTEVIDEKQLMARLAEGRPLRVKLGIDPTGPDLHLGHAVNLWKMRQFQELGHTAVLLIGDYTAAIGDPSGKNATRPPLTPEQIQENYASYEEQAFKVLKRENVEVRRQSEWYGDFKLHDIIKLLAQDSVGHVLSHETFRKRLENEDPFSAHELLYPFLQGYDSVALKADVELGASEQKFNLLMGRTIQKAYGQEPQDVVISPYLLGTDGKEKMSKSLNNYIGLQGEPTEMFGRVMSVRDDEIILYFTLATPVPTEAIREIEESMTDGMAARDAKLKLAETITAVYWGEEEAAKAKEQFLSVFQKHETPEELLTHKMPRDEMPLAEVLAAAGLATSKSEARRHIEQGAVYVDEERMSDPSATLDTSAPHTVRVGRRRMARIERD
ncbi:MAG: tyrosine--tRNA ligase [Candidatus Spechtbacterales bacterium]